MIARETPPRIVLRPERRSPEVSEFEEKLRNKFVGQDDAVSQFVNMYQTLLAGMSLPGRPIANLLFLGPTGSGKTRLVEAAAEILFGSHQAMIKIDCAEFQMSHEIAKLLGSPPGYVGHRETAPALTQEAIDIFHTDKLKMTFVLFDEIEKASDALWQLLLGILDKASLTLGDNRHVDFSRTVVVMTSNLGAMEMSRAISGSIGFAPPQTPGSAGRTNQKIHRVAVEAAKRKFSPEFINRIDKVVVFQMLTPEQLEEILEIELKQVQERILLTRQDHLFAFRCTPEAKVFLLKEGTDSKYGARQLRRAIERHLVVPLSRLMATGQIESGDMVAVDLGPDGNSLYFTKQNRTPAASDLSPAAPPLSDEDSSTPGTGPRPQRTVSRSKGH